MSLNSSQLPSLFPVFRSSRLFLMATLCALTVLLTGCGSGSSGLGAQTDLQPQNMSADIATGTTVFGMDSDVVDMNAANVVLSPFYHLSPVLPAEPSSLDSWGQSLSAYYQPQQNIIPHTLVSLPTRNLLPGTLQPSTGFISPFTGMTPFVSSTYTPAQIRAAYGLTAVPASFSGLSALQLAQFGAGQTIYIVDSNHDPMAANELAAFNQKFGLPACTTKSLAVNASLPLSAPSATSCEFYQVYSTSSGGITSTAPSYDPNWAVEIALDVQWAHATAPLARIVLIESADASVSGLTGAIRLANRMGPGAVSMSFGGAEGSYVTSLDSYFQAPGMSYFAATGDNGEAVNWPSVSPYVVAVGGTSLSYSGSGQRSEVTWTNTGGGVSAFVPTPSYQNSAVPGMLNYGRRSAADVAFNADPSTGQFIAAIQNQTSCSPCQVGWLTVGGTSLSTPQWAGLGAVANAMRVQAGKTVLGAPHSVLYGQIASNPSAYATDFGDVTLGSDGPCATCSAKKGYDVPTGLGSPNVASLLTRLVGGSTPVTPPVVTGAVINGTAGKALTFTATIINSNPTTLSLTNAPSGMSIASNGVVSWGSPIVGNYAVTVVAKDTKTGLTGQGIYNLVITPPSPPVVTSATINGTVGNALTFSVVVTNANPYTLSMSGAPSGMTISSVGVLSWSKPVSGTYTVTVSAKDNVTGLTGSGVMRISITTAAPPVVSSGNVAGVQGSALSFNVAVTNVNPYTLSLTGAPSGMTLSGNVVRWPNPVNGTYSVKVVAMDSKTGLIGQGTYSVSITASSGPIITATGLTGVAGKALSGMILVTNSSGSITKVSVGGAPLGMSFNPVNGSLNTIAVNWAAPVAGTYNLIFIAVNSSGVMKQVSLPVSIAAR